jgi:hypothetical protein
VSGEEQEILSCGKEKYQEEKMMDPSSRPFAVDFAKPPGAGFYPRDLTEGEWSTYLEGHPEQATRLNNLFTMVERNEEGEMVALNYSQVTIQILLLLLQARPGSRCNTCSPGIPRAPGASQGPHETGCRDH